LKYVILFTYEDILNTAPIIVRGRNFEGEYNGRQPYITLVYSNENNIDQKQSEEQYEDIATYNDMFVQLNLGKDFCQNYYGSINRQPELQQRCQQAALGLANNGLKLGITAIVTKCQDTIIKYQQTKKTEKDIFESINAQDLFDATNILEYINDALKTLRDLFISNLKAGLEKQGQFELYKLLIFFIMIFIIFLGIYIPYLNNLSVRIWKTKGM
jgi:hypothetical protein